MTDKVYMNLTTGEITESHTMAVFWFRLGDNIAIYVGQECRCTWEH